MSNHSILIVEDQRDIRQMLRYALESTGRDFQVLDVPSGEEALLLLSRQKIQLMIVDIRLAGISGLELMGKARTRQPDLKVILITGITDPEVREKIAGAGADAYFYKPVPMTDFLNTVDSCLGLAPGENAGGMQEPAVEIKPGVKLAGVLSDFRQETGVVSILLLDESSQVLAQSGDLPSGVDQAGLFASLAQARLAGFRISEQLNCRDPEELLFLSGKELDLYTAYIQSSTLAALTAHHYAPGARQAMLRSFSEVVEKIRDPFIGDNLRAQESSRSPVAETLPEQSAGPQGPAEEALGEAEYREPDLQISPALEETLPLDKTLPQDRTPGEPERVSQAAESAVEDVEEDHPDLDSLFQQDMDTKDVDNFWEALSDQNDGENSLNQGMLSYEQARRLGLTPDEGD